MPVEIICGPSSTTSHAAAADLGFNSPVRPSRPFVAPPSEHVLHFAPRRRRLFFLLWRPHEKMDELDEKRCPPFGFIFTGRFGE